MDHERIAEAGDRSTERSISIAPLRSASAELASALSYVRSPAAHADAQLYRHLRAGAIQGFEVAYELAVATLRRVLAAREPDAEAISRLSFNQLLRLGYDRGLVREEFVVWAGFRDSRNRTSHVYSERVAESTLEAIPHFLAELEDLVAALESATS